PRLRRQLAEEVARRPLVLVESAQEERRARAPIRLDLRADQRRAEHVPIARSIERVAAWVVRVVDRAPVPGSAAQMEAPPGIADVRRQGLPYPVTQSDVDLPIQARLPVLVPVHVERRVVPALVAPLGPRRAIPKAQLDPDLAGLAVLPGPRLCLHGVLPL